MENIPSLDVKSVFSLLSIWIWSLLNVGMNLGGFFEKSVSGMQTITHSEYDSNGSRSKSYITLCQRLREIPETKSNRNK